VWNYLIFLVGEYSSVWPEICRLLSRFQCRFLRWISGKHYFGRIFQKFSRKPRLPSTEICEILPYFLQFSFCVRIALKKFTQVLSYVSCTRVRRHVHKRNRKRRYREIKPRHFVFGKPVWFTLGLGLTTPYSLGVLVWNFYQMSVTVSIEFWIRFEPQIRPTILAINFLLITSMAERKVRSCVKLFDFFRGWILIRLNLNLLSFVPNSLEILFLNFRKKLLLENFSEIFAQTKAIFYRKLWNSALLSTIFILRSYCAKKIHTSTFICCLHPGNKARPWKNHKKKIRGRKARTFCFGKTSFVHSRARTYYALLLGCFVLKLLLDVHHCIYWVLAEIWAPDSSHKIDNKFCYWSLRGLKKRFVRVWNCLISFVGEYSSVWPKICCVLTEFSRDSYFAKKLYQEYFSEIFTQTKALPKLVKFWPIFYNFHSASALRWKNSHKYFHMFLALG